ncbi:hypothetical protein KSZ_33240 [Dictyobacter formicarum]|uniref:Uncharacterized protein n=1 Tax=Dictyobacter formicarum TaxID=2778368 RepID=A0ABQ3VHN1_9CHLR|nr:hypothetical protein KSZ_33240 [Dictyobacter formicarum]
MDPNVANYLAGQNVKRRYKQQCCIEKDVSLQEQRFCKKEASLAWHNYYVLGSVQMVFAGVY